MKPSKVRSYLIISSTAVRAAMRRQHHWAVLLSSLATAAADPATFSLGDLKQFTGSAVSPPVISPPRGR